MNDRRSFLRGVFGGITAGGLIIVATPKEVEAFAAPLKPSQPLVLDPLPPTAPAFERGMVLYNARGERVVEIQQGQIEFRRGDVTLVHLTGYALIGAADVVFGRIR